MIQRLFQSKTAPDVNAETRKQPRHVSYSRFARGLKAGELEQIVIKPNSSLAAALTKEGDVIDAQVVSNPELWKLLTHTDADVSIDVSAPPNALETASLVMTLLFTFIMIRSFGSLFFRGKGDSGAGGMNPFAQFNDQVFEIDADVSTRLEDVEGIDNAKRELEEIVDFLKNPELFTANGAKIPNGAILTGLPGCGKTLLARAIAGEANVPFINCSGSAFVEMFVGVGAQRVRQLFALARENQPCIIFIDEVDAVARARSAGGTASNDEREQTINQILTEMDGFTENEGIVVLAATNRLDVIDDALLRPGRFDRKIEVSLPTRDGRRRILDVHAKNKRLADDVDTADIAAQTTGFSGADLENLLNEAAITAVQRTDGVITSEIVEDVFQRVVIGQRGESRFNRKTRDLIAYHEAGHAIVGALQSDYDTVRKVSIIPRGDAGGITFFQPTEDVALHSKLYYESQIRVALGGRVAEELVFGPSNVTTGASSDLKAVHAIARAMIVDWGFGERHYDSIQASDMTRRAMDREIDELIKRLYTETLALLVKHRHRLEELKEKLVEDEIVDGDYVYSLVALYNDTPDARA